MTSLSASAENDSNYRAISEIGSYHVHVYFDPAKTRHAAERLRAGVGDRFPVRLGNWHDRLVGPHGQAMFQISFDVALFGTLVPWLMLNNEGLSMLIHPNTLNPRRDHAVDAVWIGPQVAISADILPEIMDAPEMVQEINTCPSKTSDDR